MGVVFDSELSFVSHCKEKINRAYSMLGLINRNFIYLTFVTLYKSLVRSHLEYANSVWNPHRQGLTKDLEKVQMRATKLVLNVKHLTYKERLLQLKLPIIKYRHLRGDMIEDFEIITGKCLPSVFKNIKIVVNHRCHYDLRKYFFCTRIINTWNSLPESVISASTPLRIS